MKKSNKKFECTVESYGQYTVWDKKSKDLPKIIKFTTEITAKLGNEFGLILRIRKGKGVQLDFCISHPPFTDKDGEIAPDFTGKQLVTSNDYYFFIGDSIWEPIEDKKGTWEIQVSHNNQLLVKKSFNII